MTPGGELPEVNDLCRIVKACECAEGASILNTIYHVREIFRASRVQCAGCDRTLAENVLVASDLANGRGCILTWTRRIPPLSPDEAADTLAEVAADNKSPEGAPA